MPIKYRVGSRFEKFKNHCYMETVTCYMGYIFNLNYAHGIRKAGLHKQTGFKVNTFPVRFVQPHGFSP